MRNRRCFLLNIIVRAFRPLPGKKMQKKFISVYISMLPKWKNSISIVEPKNERKFSKSKLKQKVFSTQLQKQQKAKQKLLKFALFFEARLHFAFCTSNINFNSAKMNNNFNSLITKANLSRFHFAAITLKRKQTEILATWKN